MLALRPRGGGGPAHLGHPRPQPPGGPQLGDGQELVGGGRVPELQLRAGGVHAEARRGQRPQVGHAGGQRAAQLLGGRAARLVVRERVHGQRAHPRRLVGAPAGQGGRRLQVTGQAVGAAGPGHHAQRVGAQGARRLGRCHALRVAEPEPGVGRRGEVRARVQGDGRQVEVDAVERGGQVRRRHPAVPDGQPQGGDAVLQVGQDRLVGAPRIGVRVALPDVPARDGAAGGPAGPYERGESGAADGIGGGRVLGGVERADLDAVFERGGEHVFGGGAGRLRGARFAQYAFDQALPLLTVRVGERGGQREFGGLGGHGSRLGERSLAAAGHRAVTLHSLTWDCSIGKLYDRPPGRVRTRE